MAELLTYLYIIPISKIWKQTAQVYLQQDADRFCYGRNAHQSRRQELRKQRIACYAGGLWPDGGTLSPSPRRLLILDLRRDTPKRDHRASRMLDIFPRNSYAADIFILRYLIHNIKHKLFNDRAQCRAPVFFSSAFSAIASKAPSSIVSSTSSSARSFWYCLIMALRGSRRILTSISFVSACREQMIGRRPRNSGIMPNVRRSSTVTRSSMFGSSSYLSFKSDRNPIDA